GCQPSDYVEGILHVCRLYKESPLPCVSGVTGADVKKRLRAILSGNVACEWDMRKKIALMAAGLAALAVPVAIGMLNAAPVSAKFEAASVKPSGPRDPNYFSVSFTGGPGTKDPTLFRCVNFSLAGLVAQAYSLTDVQVKAPQWMHDQLFDISAKVPEGATREEFRTMLQNLLADRFGLAVHHESKERSIYNLVVAEGGPKMKKAAEDADARPKPPLPKGRVGRFRAKETMASFTAYLTNFTGTFVHDATGLNGEYETNFTWIQEETGSLERALQEQLGLKLVATRAPVDYLVVDHAEKSPAEN
ncbi:MAG TPA: TIGR03435 family protein, partial [Bryobacteraceae bacterium]|nr:TIGR03435 family protein [Bryobacteraceae bacterium]